MVGGEEMCWGESGFRVHCWSGTALLEPINYLKSAYLVKFIAIKVTIYDVVLLDALYESYGAYYLEEKFLPIHHCQAKLIWLLLFVI